jgi:ABC-2 type transport system permease protein
VLTETSIIFVRQMRILLRNPVWVVFGLAQPILFLGLFGPLLENLSTDGLGGRDSWRILVPGLLVQLVIFGGGFAGFGIIQELREGVVDRQRVTPVHRSALLLGRSLTTMVTSVVQAAILVVVAIPFGLRASWLGVGASLLLVAILALGMASASYALGLILKDEDAFAPVVQGVTLPLFLLSGVLLPMSLAPTWLRWASAALPLRHLVDGTRALFAGDYDDPEIVIGLTSTAALVIVLGWWATRQFTRANR